MEHGTIQRIEGTEWQCRNCGKLGTFAQLNAANDCPSTQPIGVEICPTCQGSDTACEDCDGYGTVTVAQANLIRNGFKPF